jgi:hypothetical protein
MSRSISSSVRFFVSGTLNQKNTIAEPEEHDRRDADHTVDPERQGLADRGDLLEEEAPWTSAGRSSRRSPVSTPPAAADDTVLESAALAELAEAFGTLVGARAADENVDVVAPRRIVQLAVDCMPRAQHAAVIVVRDGEVRSIAATSGLPGRVDRIRAATGQGPGLDVLVANELVLSNDLAGDPRWPLFAGRLVDELGVRSILSYRLYLGPRERAAVNFYSD